MKKCIVPRNAALLTAVCVSSLAVVGCGIGPTTASEPVPIQGVALKGNVHGGQQPVSGATIQLYAASKLGYGAAATPLISRTVLTDAGGGFSITGEYSCTGNPEVYLVATGGNPGLAANTNNTALAMMAALGPCAQLSSSTFIFINELTTVASVWALSPFMTDVTHMGTGTGNANGMLNAFAAVNKLVNTSTGAVSGPALPANAVLPVAEINTLADIVATCVNSNGGSPGDGGSCDHLFSLTTSGSRPTDTIGASLAIAKNPGTNVSQIWLLMPPQPPFQATLTAAPNDWTIAINYTGGGLSAPKGIAVDAAGNVWVPNAGSNSVTQLANTGAALSPASGYGGLSVPDAIAIDSAGNAWVANYGTPAGNSSVAVLSSTGALLNTFTGGGLNRPGAISLDAAGNVWLANSGANTLSAFTSSGSPLSANGFSGAGLNLPVAVTVNPQ